MKNGPTRLMVHAAQFSGRNFKKSLLLTWRKYSISRKHAVRSHYVARMWGKAFNLMMRLEKIVEHGWADDGHIDWIGLPYPITIGQLLSNVRKEYLAQQSASKWERNYLSDLESGSD